ncbi:unnamed protein product [Camellia sinensis]
MARPSKKISNKKSEQKFQKSSKKSFKPTSKTDETQVLAMQLQDDVPDFPRATARGGGSSSLGKEVDEVDGDDVDMEFESGERELNNNNYKNKNKRLQKRNHSAEEDDLGSLFGDGISGKLPRFANKITLKTAIPILIGTKFDDFVQLLLDLQWTIVTQQQFAQRSPVRKLQYIAELERNVQALQAEGSEFSAELEFLNQQNLILTMENKALKQRLESLAQEQLIKYWWSMKYWKEKLEGCEPCVNNNNNCLLVIDATNTNISPGMKLWGVIAEVNEKDIIISLPGGLRGLVRASEAFDPISDNKVKVITAYVKSIEDHGYILHFGLPSFTGFMSKNSQAALSELGLDPGDDPTSLCHVEQVVKCRVTSSVPASRRINLSFVITPARVTDDDVAKLGTIVSGVVERVTPHAAIVRVNAKGYTKGTICAEHLSDHQGLVGLMKSVLKPGYEFDQLLVLVIHGYVCNLIESGCFVRYIDRLTGFAPRSKRREVVPSQKVTFFETASSAVAKSHICCDGKLCRLKKSHFLRRQVVSSQKVPSHKPTFLVVIPSSVVLGILRYLWEKGDNGGHSLSYAPMCGEKDIHVFGIFDGHRGAVAAEFSARALPGFLQSLGSIKSPSDALLEAFVKTDVAFRNELDSHRKSKGVIQKDWHPGCTAIVALIVRNKLFVANAGDCSSMLCRAGNAYALSKDHVASCPEEREHIISEGGQVKWQVDTWRVGPAALQVTRSIGDDDMKPVVTAEPEITETILYVEDEYLRWLWDVMSNAEIVCIIKDIVKEPGMCSKRLATEAAERGSKDNIIVIVVFLHPVSIAERIY